MKNIVRLPSRSPVRTLVGCLLLGVLGSIGPAGCELSRKKTYHNEELAPEAYQLPYDFDQPTDKYFLGEDLEEISGLSWFEGNRLACVQDESGRVFVYDPETDKVTRRIKFGRSGDYEGVEWVGDSLYVIKSDGTLLSFPAADDEPVVTTTELPFTGDIDVEGLGYDPRRKHLLLAVKTLRDSSDKAVTDKLVYAFDPVRRQLLPEPFITLRQDVLESFLKTHETAKTAKKATRKKEEKVVYKPSGVAVHPVTGEVYLLASDGKKLLVLDRQGTIRAAVQLSPRMLKQPEGICFAPGGDLYISSEGRGADGFILRFAYVKEG
jgi:uncharacterized protein YjiK